MAVLTLATSSVDMANSRPEDAASTAAVPTAACSRACPPGAAAPAAPAAASAPSSGGSAPTGGGAPPGGGAPSSPSTHGEDGWV